MMRTEDMIHDEVIRKYRKDKEVLLCVFSPPGKTYMCGDESCWIGQLVVPPHPEGEEDDGRQAYDRNQGVQQSAEELGLLGEWVGGGCEERGREDELFIFL